MVEHYKQLTRRFNSLRTKKRYREKRERRAYLTEAYNDGELHLYKPEYVTPIDKMHEQAIKFPDMIVEAPIYQKPVRLNWFEKFLLWIKNIFK